MSSNKNMKGNNGPGCAWYTLDQHRSFDVSSASPGYRSSNITGMHKREGYGHSRTFMWWIREEDF
jgi:hypothetical protein